ncbi:MAG TPA: hypothetical protein ACFE0H_05435 [Elainellaceae cyanobacterium]
MLPPVIDEGIIFPFKFWFEQTIQDGMYYQNELFYRLHTVPAPLRARLYHYACKLAQQDTVIVSSSDSMCSVWVSLHSPNIMSKQLRKQELPAFLNIELNGSPNPNCY